MELASVKSCVFVIFVVCLVVSGLNAETNTISSYQIYRDTNKPGEPMASGAKNVVRDIPERKKPLLQLGLSSLTELSLKSEVEQLFKFDSKYGCDVQYYYDDTSTVVGIMYTPDGNYSSHFATRFSVESFKVACTLKVTSIWMHGGFITGEPDMRVYIWADDGTGLPGDALDSLDIPHSEMPSSGYKWVEADWSAHGKVRVFTAGTDYHVGWTILPNAPGDQLACVADQATGIHVDELRTSIKYTGWPGWYLMVDSPYSKNYGLYIRNERCCTGVDCDIECPPWSSPEGEPTGCDNPDLTNAGCNGDPLAFTTIVCGDTICGSSGTFIVNNEIYHRDTDWYELTLSDTQTVIWKVTAEFDVLLGLVETIPPGTGNCADNTGYIEPYAIETICNPAQIRVTLPPGIHWFFVAPASFYDTIGCEAVYLASLECQECPLDYDCDNVQNSLDNCPMVYNPNQADDDGDGWGNACDLLTPRFEASPRYGAAPLAVSFTDKSTGAEPISERTWTFGDGQSSQEINPTHYYSTPGSYDVSLIVSSSDGSDTAHYKNFIYVVNNTEILSFTSSSIFPATGIRNIQTADLDFDNNLDLVLCDMLATYLIISYGNGDGTFTPPETLISNFDYFDFAFVNGDSLMDIVAANYSNIAVLLNNGARGFTTVFTPRDAPEQIATVASGYYNDDPLTDIFVGMDEVYYGNGQGGFPTAIVVSEDICNNALSADMADFNRDGFDDLVLGGICDTAKIFLSTGGYAFTQSAAIAVKKFTAEITTGNTLADFNRDGNCDFALIDPDRYISYIYIGYGDGSGGLTALDTLFVYGQTYTLAAIDINRDLCLDIVSVNNRDKTVEIFLGDESGLFSGPIVVDIEGAFSSSTVMTSGDFDRDGNPDLAIGSVYGEYEILILTNNLPDAPIIDAEMVTTGYDNVAFRISNPDSFMISRDYTTVAGSDYRRLNIDNNSSLDDLSVDYNVQYGEYRIVISPDPNLPPDPVFSMGIRIDGTAQAVIFNDYAFSGIARGTKSQAKSDSIVFYYTVEPVSSIEPANGVPTAENPPTFNWSRAVEGIAADNFHFQLDRTYDFSSPDLMYDADGLTEPEFPLPAPLGIDSVFYWRFRYYASGTWSEFSRTFAVFMVAMYDCGDVSGDSLVNILDIIYLINFKFKGGPSPVSMNSGDVNSDGIINILDIIYLIDYKFKGGPAPSCP